MRWSAWAAVCLVAAAAYAADPPGPLGGSHAAKACEACHSGDRVADCDACHPPTANPHPVGVRAWGDVPAGLPLGPDNKVLCRTCHRLHGGKPGEAYLREAGDHTYLSRRAFCSACHGKGMSGFNPHLGRHGESRCTFCHVSAADAGAGPGWALRDDVLKLCRFCHGWEAEEHLKSVDLAGPFPKGVPLGKDGAPMCTTCHDPHGTTVVTHHLRPEIAERYGRWQEQSPHGENYAGCRGCHKTSFSDQIRPPDFALLYHGDRNLLCLACHMTERGHHPTGIPLPAAVRARYAKSALRIPLDEKGRITCLTCHDNGCSTGHQKMQVRFYEKAALKGDLCWACHDRSEFAMRDPHVDDPSQCKWCHQSRPVPGLNVQKTLSASSTMVCLLCHEPDKHPAKASHLVVPPEKYRPSRLLPVGPLGEVTCSTCHDPHIQVVPLPKRLRLKGDALCQHCHRR